MRKSFWFLSVLLAVALVCSGCGISLETFGLGKLESLFSNEPIICTVTEANGSLVTVEVLSPDSSYKVGEVLLLDCAGTDASYQPKAGDTVTFVYDYLTDVTVQNNMPYIRVTSVSPAQYIPPATTDTE